MNPTLFITDLARTSLEAGVLVLLVVGLQRLFRRHLTPEWSCALWLLVVIRLLPVSLSSSVSLFNLLPRWFEPRIISLAPAAPTNPAAPSASAPVFLLGKSA